MLLLVLSMTPLFTSCEDDDDKIGTPVEHNFNLYVSGAYNGRMQNYLSSNHFNETLILDTLNQKIVIMPIEGTTDKATLTYHDWTYMGMNYGNLVISPVTISLLYGNYMITGSCTQMLGKGNRTFEAKLTVDGTIGRENHQCNLQLGVEMPVPGNPLNFKLVYEGNPVAIN